MKRVILLWVLILLISSGFIFAAVPGKINYQGRLIKDGLPVDGTRKMRFSIYNSDVGGTLRWSSGDTNVTVYNGLFRYVLDLSTIDWAAGETLYLEVKVESDILTPREEIYGSPYAINSHLLEGATKEYFLNTSGETQTKQGNLNITGNVGIGTTNPQAKLHIGGSAGVDGIRFPDNTLMTTAAPVGTVANIVMVQTRQQDTYSAPTSGNGTVITPLNLVITPKKAGNRIILEWIVNGETHNNAVYIVTRNGILLADATNATNNRWAGITAQPWDTDNNSTPQNVVVKIIDMNSLDVTTTYELRVRSSSADYDNTLYLNRTIGSAGQDVYEAGLSVGTATEIWW